VKAIAKLQQKLLHFDWREQHATLLSRPLSRRISMLFYDENKAYLLQGQDLVSEGQPRKVLAYVHNLFCVVADTHNIVGQIHQLPSDRW
jgi:hypothetical protein